MKYSKHVVVGTVIMGLLPFSVNAAEIALKDKCEKTMRLATDFFRTQISTEGGYLWRYSEDLSLREGEGKATDTMVWVQPPGTPSVGMVYLRAYEATGDLYYLDAARDVAYALVKGQLRSGGWDYRIEFEPNRRHRYAYRTEPYREGARNVSTLDDNNTQSAVRLLMRVDRALDFKDEKIHEAAEFALSTLLKVQYPNGAWPQRFSTAPDPSRFPVKKAGYPDSWSWTFPNRDYKSFYTFNDNTIADTIATMLEAFDIYHDAKYQAAAQKAGDFILLAQMPEPQPAWAQQYNADMHPAWARKFEPPAVTGGESQGIMRTLLELCRATGNKKYLEPLPRAIEYLRRSRLPDGRLARFYELKTNKPLYFTREDYKLTYSDADMPTHYSFKTYYGIESIAREYESLQVLDPVELKRPEKIRAPRLNRSLTARTKSIIDQLDEQGRWVENGRMRGDGQDDPPRRVIDCRTFINNITVLSTYLRAVR
ncbi:MAG: pectate lyase [Planctomycetota bacterium]|jgi:PelA/Pel-15E family pectate lyase